MQPMLSHYCDCTYNTAVPYSPSIFSQNIACSHCGAISTGINVQSKAAEEASMQQDELAQMFAAHMSLSQGIPLQTPQPQQQVYQEEPVQQSQEQEHAPKQIVYASTHYTHSHHVAPARSASEPAGKTHIDSSDLAAILLRNSIDPALLFPSQIDLFQNADDDQRLRLLELWRISPPAGRQGQPAGAGYELSKQLYDWPPTSLAQEESMAKLRYERQQQESNNASPITTSAEPYMASGYEMMAAREYEKSVQAAENSWTNASTYNQATDPVYANTGSNGLWQKNVGSVMDMENNYGAFAYARENGFQNMHADEEMVM